MEIEVVRKAIALSHLSRPRDNNRSRPVEDPAIQRRIIEIVGQLVRDDG